MKLNTQNVPNFDINRYLGKWYQIATIPAWFQKKLVNVTAEYSLRKDGLIEVRNSGFGTVTGLKSSIKGTARVANRLNPSALKVKFFFAEADYFVLEIDEDYQFALVGSSDKDSLWILSRSNNMPESVYQDLVQKAKERGYSISKLIKT